MWTGSESHSSLVANCTCVLFFIFYNVFYFFLTSCTNIPLSFNVFLTRDIYTFHPEDGKKKKPKRQTERRHSVLWMFIYTYMIIWCFRENTDLHTDLQTEKSNQKWLKPYSQGAAVVCVSVFLFVFVCLKKYIIHTLAHLGHLCFRNVEMLFWSPLNGPQAMLLFIRTIFFCCF